MDVVQIGSMRNRIAQWFEKYVESLSVRSAGASSPSFVNDADLTC